ncbi:ras GTPase-activating protein nGAP isoform X3 [Folsomia candida]|uniref:Putative Ras GTPase-activating protein n=1 Tax=Folsomia candida TaxID=158441 RepID=A0A226EMB9_FOLCA|nr:ras GTPase-activating protein nGAP isoform X3 [Folsomia candida]XP_035704765.1 ras GTPase-activating protein nGAP isoform X3 [Folsomia candida]OXA58440.1 putative Ras GTPase-activating protein [Folsomia candida]
MASSTGKFTVREIKKRSKKSRTLPVRLKFLPKGSSFSRGCKNLTPPPATKATNLSIFRNADGDPWCFDVDAYGIYMDVSNPSRSFGGESQASREDERPRSVIGYEDLRGRSKSLTRADAERKHQELLTHRNTSSLTCGSSSVRSRSRSRSRLQNMNASIANFSQCFGFGTGPVEDSDFEDYSEYYGSGSVASFCGSDDFGSREWGKVSRRLPFDEDDKYYPSDTSYDKACSSTERERRSSAPLTPLLGGRETSSRFANFFSKRSFKSNPLKRTKSVTKLERKKSGGGLDNDSGLLYPSRLRTSRSHESLLAWTNHSVSNLVNNGMMSTIELAGGNVTIRPLHPSVLGQDFAFQISAPVGSKYYLCSSAAERDAWVFALRQAIKPHADEIRRQDNGLKIWVLEAKGIVGTGKSSSKKYFCELYLDDTLFARTCAKTKGDMLFWGEHFEFSQLPNCVQMITVVLFREGDKKKKKERNTCLGRVKIPVNSVNSRYLIEKWYPVVPDSSSSKDKEVPSMRVKCKYQSVDILPVRCYKSFLQYIKNEYGPVSEALESVLSVKAKEDLANALVHVLHHEGLAKEFIAELALQEILKSGDEKLTFRGNSIATKAMEAFLKLSGTEYLHSSLGPFVSHFQRSEDVCDCEVDPMKLSPGADLLKNQRNLRMAVDTVWKSILHSHSMFPVELRECFSHCREALRTAGKDEISDHLISASLYLRFLCPAVLSPSLFNITNEYPTEKSARNLTLVAKVLQTLANFTKFQGKESYMEFINEFLEKEASSMKAFLSCISSPLTADMAKKPKVPPGGFIDLGKYSSILSTLLAENVAKIAPKNDRFKPLQEILETIHLWLKQPANATNIASFPFPPHVTTPAPTIPPPPAPLGVPMSYRGNNNNTPSSLHSQGGSNNSSNHQYQVPVGPSPIYAVSSVLHNNANPNVKNISQMNNRNWVDNNNGHQLALQLQIPQAAQPQTAVLSNNHRSGSQASSGYQSQSPVLEGDDKTKKAAVNANINTQIGHPQSNNRDETGNTTALTFTNPTFHRKVGSHSVDNLSSLGVDFLNQSIVKRRLARSSSSSDCEPEQMPMPMKPKLRSGVASDVLYGNLQPSSSSSHSKQPIKSNHNRLHRRSSAELLRKNHPYSSSTDDEEYDAPINQQRQEITPQLPPRRGQLKRNSALRPTPIVDGSFNETLQEDMRKSFQEGVPGINCSEYEREMVDLRRAMEVLQVKLSRAEERLFGSEGNGQSQQPQQQQQQQQRDGDRFFSSSFVQSPGVNNVRMEEDKSRDMDHLLQRLLSAEEEMRREQELLVALDKKQQLIDAQEEKIARLDSVNNQLLDALAQIRDTLQQQHVQQQQQKIQQQLVYHQQHLQNLSNSMIPAANGYPRNSTNRKNSSYDRTNFNPHGRQTTTRDSESHSMYRSNSINNINNNTTKVLITNGNNNDSSMQQTPHQSNNCDIDNRNDSNRNSATYLGEQALQMLAELKSSSC